MKDNESLASGIFSALLATCVSIWYHLKSEQINNRREILRLVTGWLDDFYSALQILAAHKEELFTNGNQAPLTDEYHQLNNKLRSLILTEKVPIETRCVYDDHQVYQIVLKLREDLIKVARLYWSGREENWKEIHNKIKLSFEHQIDPARIRLIDQIFRSLSYKYFIPFIK